VLRFVKESAAVVYCSRNPNNGADKQRLIASIPGACDKVHCVAADSGNREQMFYLVEQAVARFGGADLVVANAQGIAPMHPVEDKPESDFVMTLATGFYQSLWAAQAAFPHRYLPP
jgi:NAD(P)-dependent dehydrogenase (short-subunit alcohol dehydrogenase family)